MLRELVELASRLRAEGELYPTAYKPRTINWLIDLTAPNEAQARGRFKPGEFRTIIAPTRQRSGKIGPDNLKPYLLVDDARYALGIPEPGKVEEASLAHQGFVDLLRVAYERTNDRDLARILEFLEAPLPEELRQRIGPKDVVAFQCDPAILPFEKETIQRFWANYLGEELSTGVEGSCLICGEKSYVLRVLPFEIVILGQKCQVTSFNLEAFRSFGKAQTANAPLCYSCTSSALQALDHLIRDSRYHTVIARDTRKGQTNPLRNQLAVFWLREPATVSQDNELVEIDASTLAALTYDEPGQEDSAAPPPELAQLERFLEIPLRGQENALRLSTNSFYLAILTANKGRLMVREWISVSLRELHEHLGKFVQAMRICNPAGKAPRPFAIPALMSALDNGDSGLVTQLVRTAYRGFPPPRELQNMAVLRFRIQDKSTSDQRERQSQEQRRHTLAAALKLVLTYDRKEAKYMEDLDHTCDDPAYLYGRLLAIVEEIQRRASGGKLNSTLVERFYGSASTMPAATAGTLVHLAEVAYLPKLRRGRGGYDGMRRLLEEVWSKLKDSKNRLPAALTPQMQAEFALGFYCQRAAFRAEWERRRQAAQSNHNRTGGVA